MKFINLVKKSLFITLIVLAFADASKLRRVDKAAMWTCPDGQFSVSLTVWGNSYNGRDYADDVDRECLDPSKGIININIKGHYANINNFFDRRWVEASTDAYNIKEKVCSNFSLLKSYSLSGSRLVFCRNQNPGDYKNVAWEDHIYVVEAGTGNSDKLKAFYDSLTSDCKKPLTIDNKDIA
jgi:hypothetical protein